MATQHPLISRLCVICRVLLEFLRHPSSLPAYHPHPHPFYRSTNILLPSSPQTPKVISSSKNEKMIYGEVATLTPLVIMGIGLAILRSKFTIVSDHDPTEEQLILPQPPFCSVPDENLDKLFYFDLGGTYCLCEKQWSTNEYWQKTLSGMAFNFPHLLNGRLPQAYPLLACADSNFHPGRLERSDI